MTEYDVHWPDLHGDDLSEFRTLKALNYADAAEEVVEREEGDECSYSVGEGRETVDVLVREHDSDEAWKSFTVCGEVRFLYHAEEKPAGHKVLIWSFEHDAWWAPNECGYTGQRDQAGRYDRDRAEAICARANIGLPDASPHEEVRTP